MYSLSITAVAQSAGGQIRRPVKKPQTTNTTSVKPNPKPANKRPTSEVPKISESQRKSIIQNLVNNMVYVEGGTFMMGKENRSDNSRPVHQVKLSPFSIGKYEVTQEEWIAVMSYNPSEFKGIKHPVNYISWEDCQLFIRKLNQLTGKHFRLPTEAEWEFAARGGILSKGYEYAGGNYGARGEIMWFWTDGPHQVGGKKPNELGLYDMSGNVREWCQDWYSETYYSESPIENPQGPKTGKYHVQRGGDWMLEPSYGESTYRYYETEGYKRSPLYGFRLVL